MPSSLVTCYLGLGSNLSNELGSPVTHIQTAMQKLTEYPDIHQLVASSLYVSKPYGVTDQADFINAVVAIQTDLSPHGLLQLAQSLEQQAQRKRLRHWGERSLDVDVLLYADIRLNTSDLIIPHPELHKRNFVLVPLVEIAPHLVIHNQAITDLPMSQDWTGLSYYQF